MLKRLHRLPARTRLLSATSRQSKFFILKRMPSMLSFGRFGFVISKKVAPLAVDRNRSKRLIRSCIESLLSEINTADYLFIIRQNLSGIKREEIEKEVREALELSS